jgi:hypothetical protein
MVGPRGAVLGANLHDEGRQTSSLTLAQGQFLTIQ